MNDDLVIKLSKWYKEGNRTMKSWVKKYVYDLSFLDTRQKDKLWEKIMHKVLK